jgi:hypothetical protein
LRHWSKLRITPTSYADIKNGVLVCIHACLHGHYCSAGAQLKGLNVAKFHVPRAFSEITKDGFIVQTSGATSEDVEALMG